MSPAGSATPCRVCGGADSLHTVDFGPLPLTNRFLSIEDEPAPTFPAALQQCGVCGLIEWSQPAPASEVRARHAWLSYSEPEPHLDDTVDALVDAARLGADARILGITYKDDTTLERLVRRGFTSTARLEPERDLGIGHPLAGLESIQSVFDRAAGARLAAKLGRFEVVVVRHILEHASDPVAFVEGVAELLTPHGLVVFEVPDCERALSRLDWTMPWEEHLSYFTETSIVATMSRCRLEVVRFQRYPYATEDSLVVIARPSASAELRPAVPGASISANPGLLRRYSEGLAPARTRWRERLERVRAGGREVTIFGAGHGSIQFVNLLGLGDLVDCFIDDNPNKLGLLVPGSMRPIVPSRYLESGAVGLCLLAVRPDAQATVRQRHPSLERSGGEWRSIFPDSPFESSSA